MDDPNDTANVLEKFYVYRSLHSDESWGAVLISSGISKLPNITFGMKIIEANEKSAIAKAKKVYDKIHTYDNDKKNIREFAAAALRNFASGGTNKSAQKALAYAVKLNTLFKKHFEELEEENE